MHVELMFKSPTAEELYGTDLPLFATERSQGLDLRVVQDMVFPPGQDMMVPTGIALNMSEDLWGLLAMRSSMSAKGLWQLNGVGIIDSDYQGELFVPCLNRTHVTVYLKAGTRFAQLVFMPVMKISMARVLQFNIQTSRGEGGFGSTGER